MIDADEERIKCMLEPEGPTKIVQEQHHDAVDCKLSSCNVWPTLSRAARTVLGSEWPKMNCNGVLPRNKGERSM